MIQKVYRNFITISSKAIKEDPYLIQPALDLLSNKFRRIGLDHSVMDRRKVIVPSKRIRQKEDTLMKLQKVHECVGYIKSKNDLPELDFIFDSRQIHSIKKLRNSLTTPIYIQHEDQEYRVLLDDINYSNKNWIAWVQFQRYIIGQPNLIYLPITVKQGFSNEFINKGCDYSKKLDGVWVYTYEDNYMTKFELDPEHLTPKRPFKIGDLMNCLPYGMKLHDRYLKNLHQNILLITKDDEKKVEEALKSEMIQKKIDSGEFKAEDEDTMIKRKDTSKKDKAFKSKSLKKKLAEQSAEIKKQFAPATEKKK